MPPKAATEAISEDLLFLWKCLKHPKGSDSKIAEFQVDYDAIAALYNATKGATSKRFSRLKAKLDAATESAASKDNSKDADNGKGEDGAEALSPKTTAKGSKKRKGEDDTEVVSPKTTEKGTKKRKAESQAMGANKKKGKVTAEEAIEEEDAGISGKEVGIKDEHGSEEDKLLTVEEVGSLIEGEQNSV